MSSKKSKNASATSREAGDASKSGSKSSDAKSRPKKKKRDKAATGWEIELVHARNAHLGWLIFGVVVGGLLLWKLAFVGKLVGFVLLIIAGFAGRSFLLTVLNAPGTFKAEKQRIVVPQGLCKGKTVTFEYAQIKHAFFLRRAVPWTRAGPILIIEAENHALAYPRDWFSSDADQQRVLDLLTARGGATEEAKAS